MILSDDEYRLMLRLYDAADNDFSFPVRLVREDDVLVFQRLQRQLHYFTFSSRRYHFTRRGLDDFYNHHALQVQRDREESFRQEQQEREDRFRQEQRDLDDRIRQEQQEREDRFRQEQQEREDRFRREDIALDHQLRRKEAIRSWLQFVLGALLGWLFGGLSAVGFFHWLISLFQGSAP